MESVNKNEKKDYGILLIRIKHAKTESLLLGEEALELLESLQTLGLNDSIIIM